MKGQNVKLDHCDYCGVFGLVYGNDKSCRTCTPLPQDLSEAEKENDDG